MQNQYDLKRYAVLYVDDEEKALKYFEKSFGDEFRILTASSAAEGLRLIEQHGDDIGVLLSDQRMPGEKGVQLLENARHMRPRLVRMMVTAYADYDATVDAVNLGNIFRYISKPIQMDDMRNTLHRAMEFYILQQERDELLREKLSTLQNVLIADRVMGLGVVAGTLASHIRNPLRGLASFLDIIPDRGGRPAFDLDRLRQGTFWRDFHAHVAAQSARLADSLTEVMAVVGNEEKCQLAVAVQSVVDQQKAAYAAKGVALEIAAPLPQTEVSKAAFEKMLHLLLQAELGMLPAGKKVVLDAAIKGGAVIVSARDDSDGVAPEAVRAVFDPLLSQASPDVDGPGLALLGSVLLASHQGGIARVPRGVSGFRLDIELPVTPEEAGAAPQSSREFVTNVLMNDLLWERILQNG
ncbi:MAG: hybrid sensor histidine kinase/response regulator [Verrucomicrobiaceae bacterium]|nr:hybrid sensor histidine kinase/response regulator [Verrucomicrobiaceae bacterium]